MSFKEFPNFGLELFLILIENNVTISRFPAFLTHGGAKKVADNYSEFHRNRNF